MEDITNDCTLLALKPSGLRPANQRPYFNINHYVLIFFRLYKKIKVHFIILNKKCNLQVAIYIRTILRNIIIEITFYISLFYYPTKFCFYQKIKHHFKNQINIYFSLLRIENKTQTNI